MSEEKDVDNVAKGREIKVRSSGSRKLKMKSNSSHDAKIIDENNVNELELQTDILDQPISVSEEKTAVANDILVEEYPEKLKDKAVNSESTENKTNLNNKVATVYTKKSKGINNRNSPFNLADLKKENTVGKNDLKKRSPIAKIFFIILQLIVLSFVSYGFYKGYICVEYYNQ